MIAFREYAARLEERRAACDALGRADVRMSHARLATFASGVVLALFVWRSSLSTWWLLLPAALFAWLVHRHDRILRDRGAAARGVAWYERGLARLEDRWIG